MQLAVGADQFAGRFTLVQGFGENRRDAISGLEVVFLAERKDKLDRVHRRDGCHRSTRTPCCNIITDTEISAADNSGERRVNRGKVKIQLRLIECRAGSLDFSLRSKIGLYRVGVVLLAGDFLIEKLRLTLLVLLSFLLFGNCL